MPQTTERRRNVAPWWGLLFAIGAIVCNLVLFLVSLSWQGMLPWLSLLCAILALIFLVVGLLRAFAQAHIYRGRVLSVVLTVVSVLPIGLTAFAFVTARRLPNSVAVPQVGQRVPDFTLSDSSGKQVSLDQLLAPASTGSQAPAPKAVLLIFYRGYW